MKKKGSQGDGEVKLEDGGKDQKRKRKGEKG